MCAPHLASDRTYRRAEIIFDVGPGDVFVHIRDLVVEHAKQMVRRLLDSSRTIYDAVDNYSAAVIGVAYRLEEGRAQRVSTSGIL
jgi:carbonic anhydrase